MYTVVLITAKDKKEAQEISKSLIGARLAACVNIVNKIDSIFFWAGKIDQAKESLLIIKTKKDKLPKIVKLVKSLHSYKIPEIIALPIIAGCKSYLRWIDAAIR